ncbi:hypothetical protein VMCG_07162 [Cytospora schulzeri]|uniref:Transcription factor Iwr1 domain-containing protein n=1 Tax=Cytospora schulzeri TaxID=448051 RepID=A0A423W523_9PEZI|nr:hypothetical protein VMCG_07162 [Valsa malicola]
MPFCSSDTIMPFAWPRATIHHLFPGTQKKQIDDVQAVRAEGQGRDGDAKLSLFAKFESKLSDTHTSLKKRKHERKCLRKTYPNTGQHIDAEPPITHSRTIEYRDIDLGKRVRADRPKYNNEEEDSEYPHAAHHPNTLTAHRHSQAENILAGTAIESSDAYISIMRALGGEDTTHPPPPTRPPPPVPMNVTCADHEVTMTDASERHSRPQTRSTQRSTSDESLRLLKTRSAQSTVGSRSRRNSTETTSTSLYSIEECTEDMDTSGMDKAIEGKASHHQADADGGRNQGSPEVTSNDVKDDREKKVTSRRNPWQTMTEWHDPSLPPLETPETSEDESEDEAPKSKRRRSGLPPRMQDEINKSIALVKSLMTYESDDDPKTAEVFNGTIGAAVEPWQAASPESPKRFANIDSLRGTLSPKNDVDFKSFVNHDGDSDGDIPTPVSVTRPVGSSVAPAYEQHGEGEIDAFGSEYGSPSGLEPADMLRFYREDSSEDSEWELEADEDSDWEVGEETSSSEETPYQQAYNLDPYSSGNWTSQLCQIDEEPSDEEECDGESLVQPGEADEDWDVIELRGLMKIEGSIDAIKSHVDDYVNEGDVDFESQEQH